MNKPTWKSNFKDIENKIIRLGSDNDTLNIPMNNLSNAYFFTPNQLDVSGL